MSEEEQIQSHNAAAFDKAIEEAEMRRRRSCTPSIFHILSLGIVFLCISAVVAGVLSGDWEATFCIPLFPFSPSHKEIQTR